MVRERSGVSRELNEFAQRRQGAKVMQQNSMDENEISRLVVDAGYRIHIELGPGLLESIYEAVLAYELRDAGLKVARQVAIPLRYKKLEFEEAYRADFIVNDLVLIELKSVERLIPAHKKQVISYLKLSGLRLGLLINFGDELFKRGICRLVNGMPD